MDEYHRKQLATIESLESGAAERLSSIVPITPDHTADKRLCLTAVQFVSGDIANELLDLVQRFRLADDRHYYYPRNSLHFTVQNVRLGEFSERDIERAQQVFESVVPQFAPQPVHIRRLLELPSSLGLSLFFSQSLADMIGALRAALADAGLPDDKEYINDVVLGNITICRFQTEPNAEFIRLVKELKNVSIGDFLVREISLVTTNSICHPDDTKVHSTHLMAGMSLRAP